MKKIRLETQCKKMLADIYTPVSIYLRLRDKFRDTVLLESVNYNSAENGKSIIGINAIGGIEVKDLKQAEFKFPGQTTRIIDISNPSEVPDLLWNYMQGYQVASAGEEAARQAQGLFGYASYNAVQFFDTISLPSYKKNADVDLPLMRYRLYQYVIIINHFKNEMFLCENILNGLESDVTLIETLTKSKDVPAFPFELVGGETANKTEEQHLEMIRKGIKSCLRGDVFQIVLGRRFQQKFKGDDFNVYRALRSVNPSPYLFYFDYSDYKIMGSSPESQLVITDQEAIIHPIAGTFGRTGDAGKDKELAEKLLEDPKENAEHTMLVDLARNDLSRVCSNVYVNYFRRVHTYSHVLHIVSEVKGEVPENLNPFKLLASTFPAGTLSGAPKFRAMQLIDEFENDSRGAYGGTIGFVGFDGSINHAIIIRSFVSKKNTLYYQAGGGIVAKSIPADEVQEVHNKLGALKQSLVMAENINK